jgi:hypothetical protein
MTRTGPADVVMSACHLTAPGRPVIGRPSFRKQDSNRAGCHEPAVAAILFPGSALLKSRLTDRSGRLRPVCPPLGASARPYGNPPHPPPAQAHPLHLYLLGWHSVPLYGWSSDPGRDILCLLISPPRLPQWP